MTDAELLAALVDHKALIVHCSRTGKGDEALEGLFFPDDLRNAIDICAHQSKELCCSVIWPGHIKTFGAVGIILKPRSTRSITSICTTDGGTSVDPATGRRVGLGNPFSQQAVTDTFAKATNYTSGTCRMPTPSAFSCIRKSLSTSPGLFRWTPSRATILLWAAER